jgi:hypothetical protein
MAWTRQLETSRNLTLAVELELLDDALRVNLPPGVSLVIEGDPLDRATISAEVQDWRYLVGIYARPTGSYEEMLAYSPFLANEARAFVRSVRVALNRYLDADSLRRLEMAQRAPAAAKSSTTRQLREGRPEKPGVPSHRGPFPWVD